MKPILLLLSGALLAGGVAAGVTVFLLAGRTAEKAPQAVSLREPVRPTPASEDLEGLRGEVDMLARTIGDLQAELADLKASAMRQPLEVESEPVTPETLAAAGLTPVQIEERMRDIFAAEREREDLEEQAAREDRERASAERQAERLATELGLGSGDQTRLAEHLFTSGQKRRALFEGMREGGFDREAMRASMEELRVWNTEELYRSFSPNVAAQLEERADNLFGGRRGGGDGGGRRGGGGGGDGPGGG